MKYRKRIYYTEADKALMWDRWQKGDTLHMVGKSAWWLGERRRRPGSSSLSM